MTKGSIRTCGSSAFTILSLFLGCWAPSVVAQRQVPLRETLTPIALGTTHAGAIFGGFEQGVGLGGGVQLTSASAIPALELRAIALMSTQYAKRLDLEFLLPAIGGSRNHADVWFSYLQRDTDFFATGPGTPEDLKTSFALTQRSYQGALYRDLADHFQGGVYAQVMRSQSSGGTNTSGFTLNTRILSYGGFLAYDTRDNSIGLTRGVNLYGRIASADGLGHHDGSADYGWIEGEFDVREYAPVGSPRMSLLLRSRGQFKAPKGAGKQIPFYDLSWLGGRKYLRGYHAYRFRDNNVLLLSTELQRTVYAIAGSRGIDVFASAETGRAWGDARSSTGQMTPDNTAPGSRSWHSELGSGLQYRHSRDLAARVEVGRSHEGARIYWSLSRGF